MITFIGLLETPKFDLGIHAAGDWGCVCAEDAASNDEAIKEGLRILSAYPIDPAKPSKGWGENTVWIITEADRSVTTDADAKLNPLWGCNACITLGHATLHLDRTARSINHAGEFGQEAIAGVFDHSAPVLGDLRMDQLGEVRPEPLVRAFLIRPHQARIAGHIGG